MNKTSQVEPNLNFTAINPPEKKRTYLFPGGEKLEFEQVAAVCVRPSGSHRLETASGKKYIVAPGWLAIELDMEHWTF